MWNEEDFLKRRAQGWSRLEVLSAKAESGIRHLTGLEVVEFVKLYRQTSADLAYMTTHSSNREVVEHLNRIVGKGYGQLYRSPVKSFMAIIDDGLYAAASTMRRHKRFFWASTFLCLLGALFAFTVMATRPDLRHFFVQSEAQEELHAGWMSGEFDPRTLGEGTMMTAFYASNNPRVGINSVALGAGTAGIGTVYSLWINGVVLGALAADMQSVNLLPYLLISIAPHGVSEMGGIFVASAVGFIFAWAIFVPGRRTRADALKHAAKDGFVLFMLALVMIALAAPIEGFFSFNPMIPLWGKLLFAVLAASAWTLFFKRYGLERQQKEEALEAYKATL